MLIPTSVTIGAFPYRVYLQDPGRRRYGAINYQALTIHVRPRAAQQQAETFWHELTHGILYEMGRTDLALNEKFVTQFGSLLAKAVRTARFA